MVHKGVNFEAPNALKLTYEHLQFQKNFRGLYPRTPVKRGGEAPQFTFLATPLAAAVLFDVRPKLILRK